MLIDIIKDQQVQARRDRDADLAQLLTTFYSEAAMIGKNDGGRDTTDNEVIALAKKFINNAKEVMDNLDATDVRYTNADYEIGTLSNYLPTQLSEQEIRSAVEVIIDAKDLSTMKDMGVIMKELKSTFDGQYDGKVASQIIKELLK